MVIYQPKLIEFRAKESNESLQKLILNAGDMKSRRWHIHGRHYNYLIYK
jgi:hypothetical protein